GRHAAAVGRDPGVGVQDGVRHAPARRDGARPPPPRRAAGGAGAARRAAVRPAGRLRERDRRRAAARAVHRPRGDGGAGLERARSPAACRRAVSGRGRPGRRNPSGRRRRAAARRGGASGVPAPPAVALVVVAVPARGAARPPEWLATLVGERLALVAGGASRAQSVRAGLAALPAGAGVVLVHDGARPFVSRETIDAVIAKA